MGHNEKTNQPRSWTVVTRAYKPLLLGTNWQPGYTPAHKATREEALLYAINERDEKILALDEERDLLETIRNDLED